MAQLAARVRGLDSDSVGGGLPRSGQYVESIEIVSGMIVISYGGAANEALAAAC